VPPTSEPVAVVHEGTRGRLYKLTLLFALYVAQGLPYGFFTLAVPVLLRQEGVSLIAIGALSFLYLPWGCKFLWAPFLDHLGSRRTWLIALQSTAVLIAIALTPLDLGANTLLLVIAAFAFTLIAATQDIVTDGLAVRMLDAHERGLANAIQVGAYRLGMILGGGALLYLYARTDWSVMFACMAALLALTIVPVWWLREPTQRSTRAAVRPGALALSWLRRLTMPGMLTFCGLIVAYRFGDQLLSSLLSPFLADQQLGTAKIALMKGTLGSGSSFVGAFFGGWLAFAAGRRRALLISGLAQAGCFCLYIAAAFGAGGESLLWIATAAEGILGTMATVALFTLMMDASDPEHAGTDYTLLASVVVLVGFAGGVTGGALADALGYATTFIIGTLLSVAGCLFLVKWLDRHPTHERVAAAWTMGRDRAS
jgi:MFS family permease